ncbi:gephyrin-like molybdotransferase Glp [Kordiimonas sp. SCSIO 12610]|uniref:molybdopterin molybdotransferase MoeA n=1 Tax=Kordiimonas sp. SCSIO 12610 TaxID=2829597 RepID=UPI00210EF5B3|nr:gephyrin-like molybdotransferase Glp [Kordiimonas sp. SCSIO 12610]UTW54042.1 molybdopterin molybdotransferase MoeA [Kordiimonas sp. SCSIO 12610]
MISVENAFHRIVDDAVPLTTERLAVEASVGRVLAAPLAARKSQPGCDLSAMDGYAVNSSDLSGGPVTLKVTSTSAAGQSKISELKPGEAMQIYTGAPVPNGADQVIIQENVNRDGDNINIQENAAPGKNIRFAGNDFAAKQIVCDAGTFITPKSIGLIAGSGHSHVMVHRAPKIAILTTGDELAKPDQDTFGPQETIDSLTPTLLSFFNDAGATASSLGAIKDNPDAIKAAIRNSSDADILITVGGASVGDRDYVQEALKAEGMELDFWKIAMRPGKPMIFGKINNRFVIGLPGNPVSAFVCALVFVRPLIDKLMGRPAPLPTGVLLPSAVDLPANGVRQHYMRARLIGIPGQRMVDPAASQDSSLLSVLSQSDGLIVRPVDAPEVKAGEPVLFLPF